MPVRDFSGGYLRLEMQKDPLGSGIEIELNFIGKTLFFARQANPAPNRFFLPDIICGRSFWPEIPSTIDHVFRFAKSS